MSKALSVDLRTRVLAAVAAGATHRDAGARFGVSPASVIRENSIPIPARNAKSWLPREYLPPATG
jgi:hypothetical protein